MDSERIQRMIRAKWAAYQQAQRQAEICLAQLQAVAEAAGLKAEEVNELIGAPLFEEKPAAETPA